MPTRPSTQATIAVVPVPPNRSSTTAGRVGAVDSGQGQALAMVDPVVASPQSTRGYARPMRPAELIDGREVAGQLGQVHPVLVRPAYPIRHALGQAVGLGPDDDRAGDQAELVDAGDAVPLRQQGQRL